MFYDAGYRASPNATGRMFCGRLLISPHPVAAHHSTSSSATLNSRPHRYSRGSPRPEVQGLCHSRGHLPRRRKWPAVHQTKNSWRHWAARSHQHRGTSPGRLWRTPSPNRKSLQFSIVPHCWKANSMASSMAASGDSIVSPCPTARRGLRIGFSLPPTILMKRAVAARAWGLPRSGRHDSAAAARNENGSEPGRRVRADSNSEFRRK